MFFWYISIDCKNIIVIIDQITIAENKKPIPFFPLTDSLFLTSFNSKTFPPSLYSTTLSPSLNTIYIDIRIIQRVSFKIGSIFMLFTYWTWSYNWLKAKKNGLLTNSPSCCIFAPDCGIVVNEKNYKNDNLIVIAKISITLE